jgi:hypothetical protein
MRLFYEDRSLDYTIGDCLLLADAITDSTTIREAEATISRQDIRNQIRHGDLDTNPENFKKSLDIALKAIHGEYLSPRSLALLRQMKTFKVHTLNAGFALTRMKGATGYSEIVAVHNASPLARMGIHLVTEAVDKGGKYLECFGEHLQNVLYKTLGFEVYKFKENVRMRNGQTNTLYYMKLKGVPAPE